MTEHLATYREVLTPAEQAARMAQWLPDFVNGETDKIGYLPDLTAKRIDGLFGNTVDQAQALKVMLGILLELSRQPEDMETYGMFICGYPTEELAASCSDLDAVMERIHECLAPAIAEFDANSREIMNPVPLDARAIGSKAVRPMMKVGHEPSWQDIALCPQTDPEIFFPEKGGSTKEAKRVCMGCEVRDACLDYALENDEMFGVWGGLSGRERRRLKHDII